MLCYKDKTFCASDVKEHDCGREMTEEEKIEAETMDIPIAYGKFCEEDKFMKKVVEQRRENSQL